MTSENTSQRHDGDDKDNEITIVHCWSAPRSRSTALMYSFEARPDCQALDEPLYRAWLEDNIQTAQRAYKDFLLSGRGPTEGKGVTADWQREVLSWPQRVQRAADALPDGGGGIIFAKHMGKHAPQYDFDDELRGYRHRHMLLLRNPESVLTAWGAVAENHGNVATPEEVGIVPLLNLYATLQRRRRHVAVLDADDLVEVRMFATQNGERSLFRFFEKYLICFFPNCRIPPPWCCPTSVKTWALTMTNPC